jgi:hypothetical protein
MTMSDATIPMPFAKQGRGASVGPAIYLAGGFDIPVPNLAQVMRVINVKARASGYEARFQGTVTGNRVRVQVFETAPVAPAALQLALPPANHPHPITSVVPAGGGTPVLQAVIPGALEAAVPQTNPGAVDGALHAYGAGTNVPAAPPAEAVGANLALVNFEVDAEGF